MRQNSLFFLCAILAVTGCGRVGPSVRLPAEGKVLPQEITLPPVAKPETLARVAIIIDDAGHNLKALPDVLNLPAKVNVAILPGLEHSKEIAEKLHEKGFELMLHQPMEPNSSEMNPGPGAILTSMTDEEIARTLKKNIESLPHISGVNNHMGSKATADKRVMASVLKTTAEQKLFFVDSLTSRSKVREAATEVGVKVGRRDIFIDNEKNPEAIKKQVRQLKKIALKHGQAIGIGHFYPMTLQAIAEVLPELEKDGVQVVPVSKLIE